ncbi:prolyl oligopeptidase family serine peptidase [Aquimarina sp. 433]
MKCRFFLLVLITSSISCNEVTDKVFSYPDIKPIPAIDKYHGQQINDTYRNLENLQDSMVLRWFEEQGKFARKYLNSIPGRAKLLEDQLEFDSRQSSDIIDFRLNKYGNVFYLKREIGSDIFKLYYREKIDSEEELIYDPDKWKPNFRIKYFKVSWDATKVAISLAKGGENISTLIIYDITKKREYPEIIKNVAPDIAGGINWLPDNSGFIYQVIPNTDHRNKDYLVNTSAVLYKLGMNPSESIDVLSRKNNPDIKIEPADFPVVIIKSETTKYIYGKISGVSSYKDYYIANIEGKVDYSSLDWKPLFKKEDQIKNFVIYQDSLIYRTSKNASNFKICKTSLINPDFNNPIVLAEEINDKVIKDFEYIDGELFYITLKNGVEAEFYSVKNGIEEKIELPLSSGNSYVSYEGNSLIVTINSWTKPKQTYVFDTERRKFSIINLNSKANFPEFDDFVVEEIEVASHDGVKIPLSIIYKKGIKKDGNNRLISLSYGAYGASFSPFFSIPALTWINNGGIWVLPHVRGGGEKGDYWHKAGFKTTKSNSWKDLIACTEYLIKEGYTSKKKNIAFGVSAAGITIGRAVTERPDLFGAVVMNFPALNILRSEFQPNGPNSIKEFGTVKDSTEFEALYDMDAYHHIEKDKNYPAMLITTGMKDGSVVPWDPGKFVAKIQSTNPKGNPFLFSVDFEASHGGDGSISDYYENMVDTFSFVLWQTGHPDYQPKN